MKIKIPHYKSLSSKIEVEFSLFESFSVQTKGEISSNQFLLSLWNEFDKELGNTNGRCPWAYFPDRFRLRKSLMTFFGIVDTTIGHFYVAITYQKKGDIDNIHFYSLNSQEEYKSKIKGLIKLAINNVKDVDTFTVTAELKSIFQDLYFEEYSGNNFIILLEENKIKLRFTLKAINDFEATQLTEKRLRTLISFLSIETNIHFDYTNVIINKGQIEDTHRSSCIYQDEVLLQGTNERGEDFIDEYPIYDSKLLISKKGIEFLDKFIFTEREFENPKIVHNFLRACIHFHKGLGYESAIITPTVFLNDTQSFTFSPLGIFNKQAIINNSITFFLSSLEVISFWGAGQTTCSECNQIQYKIGQRVADFVEEYFNENLGKVFKSLYNARSKFLHTGESSSSNLNTNIKPILDSSTATGVKDYGYISLNINGSVTGVSTSNVREWTSYCFRSYYRNKIMLAK